MNANVLGPLVPTSTLSLEIAVQCASGSDYISPVVITGNGGCSYRVTMTSAAACPLQCPSAVSRTACNSPIGGECKYSSPPNAAVSCSCYPGFTGRSCDEATGLCGGKVCLNGGICNNANGYCSCANGYTGSNCEIPSPSCVQLGCVHGTCRVDPRTSTASCVSVMLMCKI